MVVLRTRHDRCARARSLADPRLGTGGSAGAKGLLLDLIDTSSAGRMRGMRRGRIACGYASICMYLHPVRSTSGAVVLVWHFSASLSLSTSAAPDADGDRLWRASSHLRYPRRGRAHRPHRPVASHPRVYPSLRHYAGTLSETSRPALISNLIQYGSIFPAYTRLIVKRCGCPK